jgi:hypothetical protein
MRREVEDKWRAGDKVGALTVSIQCTKLLHDSSSSRFQTIKFAFVIEVVERIGLLVYQRIKALTYPSMK